MRDEKVPLLDSDHQSDSDAAPSVSRPLNSTMIDLDTLTSRTDDSDPLLERKLEHPTSNFDTMVSK